MNRDEKILFHQIHPLKLAIDVSTSAASAWLLWHHDWIFAAAIALPPSIVVTALMMRFMSFERQRDSAFGRYVARHMSGIAQGVRFLGQIAMWLGAWYRQPWAIVFGAAIVLFGWSPIFHRSDRTDRSDRSDRSQVSS